MIAANATIRPKTEQNNSDIVITDNSIIATEHRYSYQVLCRSRLPRFF